jgi:hypothetical protein
VFGAAKRTLASEHGFRHECDVTGGSAGTKFLLVSLERFVVRTAGPMAARSFRDD